MSKPIITLGATTTHGGIVTEVLDTFTIDGKKIHLDGMQHFCPLCKKNVSAIGTDNTKNVMGKKMVFEGDKISCGASFIANQGLAFASSGGAALGSATVISTKNFRVNSRHIALSTTKSKMADSLKDMVINSDTSMEIG